jgi:hypothetical protein
VQLKIVQTRIFWIAWLVSSILLSVATTYAQVDDVTLRFLNVHQYNVHQQMMDGVAGNPWQYRILADWMLNPVIKLFAAVDIPIPRGGVFIIFRFLQCLLIFLSAGVYYRKLGLPLFANLFGLSVLAWGMSHSLYNSDFSFNNFFDIAFYLLAAILIMDRAFVWIPLLIIPAAFNRETSALIPLMLISYAYFDDKKSNNIKQAIVFTLVSLAIFTAIFVGLRIHYGEQQFLTADGYYPGIGLLVLNISRFVTWEQILITLSIIPFLAVFSYRAWPRSLKIFFWVVVPMWFGVHFFAALVAETRLLLVPLALVFIPGALFGIVGEQIRMDGPFEGVSL